MKESKGAHHQEYPYYKNKPDDVNYRELFVLEMFVFSR
ncbi:hypothetical protein EC12741_1584 [Escherichia coli 1.2741]|nr:hypothetical protein ECSTEC7V_2590 [Escherichia coli STEC_7v]EIG82280.1 hypothetical protein EC12741_1584 [Escherichia coli 1.2741]KDA57852.1 hypothetical protein AA98_2463 [Escherichia coli 2-011-08_S1_C1]KDW31428.1 hypothetical protein AC15_2423 [Escherichia coli 2-156-04_S3_C2]